jgi:hypothetical protein
VTQSEQLLAEFLCGRRLTKAAIRKELAIENVGGRVQDLREQGWPIATLWLDKRTHRLMVHEDGRPCAWFGETTHVGRRWECKTQQPMGSIASYQLYCVECHAVDPRILGWKTRCDGTYTIGEFKDTHKCPSCTNDALCSEGGRKLSLFTGALAV